MVTTDVRRDYYADLGLTPSAATEDLRRQYKKLEEYQAKFQAIQAAYEILGDPDVRLKYDTDRLRNGYYQSTQQNFSRSQSSKRNTYNAFTGSTVPDRASPHPRFGGKKDDTMPFRESSQRKPDKSGAVPKSNTAPRRWSKQPRSADESFHSTKNPTGAEPTPSPRERKQGFKPYTTSYRQSSRFEGLRSSAGSLGETKHTPRFQGFAGNSSPLESKERNRDYTNTGSKKPFASMGSLHRDANAPQVDEPPSMGSEPSWEPSNSESAHKQQKAPYPQEHSAPNLAQAKDPSRNCLNNSTSQKNTVQANGPGKKAQAKERLSPRPASVTTEDEEVEAASLDRIYGQQPNPEAPQPKVPAVAQILSAVAPQRISKPVWENKPTIPHQSGATGAASTPAPSQSSNIADLQDFCTTFRFRAPTKILSTKLRGVSLPQPPQYVPIGIEIQGHGMCHAVWDRYVADIRTYMKEWNTFQRQFLMQNNSIIIKVVMLRAKAVINPHMPPS
ncbi:hypothetical protein BDV12DRAFT_190662 [Aspergillus spectabilis]